MECSRKSVECKIMKRLNDDETVLLITFVQSRECLWNESNADFKRISITKKLWNEIGIQLNISGDEARSKWKNLKDKFRKVLRQVQEENNPDSASACSTGAQWKFYNAMLFLKDALQPEIVNCTGNNNTQTASGSEIATDQDFQEYDFDFLVRQTPDRESLVSIGKNRGHWSLKRKNAAGGGNTDEEVIRQPEEIQVPATGSVVRQLERKSEDDYYFLMSLLPYIQSLNPIEKLELRSRMQNLVTDSYKKHDLNKRSKH